MLMTTELHPSVLSTLTQKELEKAFELARVYNATSVRVDRCGTIEFVFNRPLIEYTLAPGGMPDPFLPSVCTLSKSECEEDDTATD